MFRRRPKSASTTVFVALLVVVAVLGTVIGGLLVWDRYRASYHEVERATQTVANTLAVSPTVRGELARATPENFEENAERLQAFGRGVIEQARVSYVTIMSPSGKRYTHRNASQIGGQYLGTIPDQYVTFTEIATGTLGDSVRTIAPVLSDDGTLLGWVSVGVTISTVGAAIEEEFPLIAGITLSLVAAGLVGAWLVRRYARQLTGDMTAEAVRDATSSYESLRTLGAAMRAQHHEHGNRLHTAVALLELGRTPEAIELLAATGRQNQDLVDRLATPATADPTMGALILGKTAEGKEVGITLNAAVDPRAPALPLHPVDAVSVVGNLIDNAFEAVLSGPGPRVVEVTLGADADGAFRIVVTDSGPGFSTEARERRFEPGFSSKQGRSAGRGIGLPLVREIVQNAGGRILIDEQPTTVRVLLPPPGERIPDHFAPEGNVRAG